jgi:hypothetical protein
MTDEPEPLNEWVVSELSRTKDALRDLARRHEEVVNRLAEVCRRNDKMQAAGNKLRAIILDFDIDGFDQGAIDEWDDANV